jgi:hypothetical protein
MEFRGKVWKTEGRPAWVVEVKSLGIITQGHTKKEAIEMLQDAVEMYLDYYFNQVPKVSVIDHGEGVIGVSCSEKKLLLSLSLIKQRQESKLTIRNVSHRLGSKSPNAYAKYERGKINISIEKFDRLLHAVNPKSYGVMLSC